MAKGSNGGKNSLREDNPVEGGGEGEEAEEVEEECHGRHDIEN